MAQRGPARAAGNNTTRIISFILMAALAVGLATPWGPRHTLAMTFAAGDRVVVDTDRLNLRTGAGLSTAVIAVLPGGTALTVTAGPVTGDDHDWYKVETRHGRRGWVAGAFLVAAPGLGFAVGDAVRVADGRQNLREEPGLGAGVVRIMAVGEVLLVLSGPVDADGYTWCQVRNYAGEGWAAGEFLRFDPTGYPPEDGG